MDGGSRSGVWSAMRGVLGTAFSVLWVALPAAAEEVRLESPGGGQAHAQVAVGTAGETVVAWRDWSSVGAYDVLARRFDSAGVPQGTSAFLVNTVTTGTQEFPDVALTQSGGFIVVWESLTGTQASGIRARVYDDQAQPIGDERLVEVDGTVLERRPTISAAPDGSFVVTWTVDYDSLRGRRLDSAGQPVGAELVLDVDGQIRRAHGVAHNNDGDFLAAWRRELTPVARLFDAAGVPLASEVSLPGSSVAGTGPGVAFNGDRFLVVWNDVDTIFGRLLESSGDEIGSPFLIADGIEPFFSSTAVAPGPDGDFEVVWNGPDDQGPGIVRRRVSSGGAPLGFEMRINSTAVGNQQLPDLAVDGAGRAAVVWEGPGVSGVGVYGCFNPVGAEIFADGFELGDTSAWTSSFP